MNKLIIPATLAQSSVSTGLKQATDSATLGLESNPGDTRTYAKLSSGYKDHNLQVCACGHYMCKICSSVSEKLVLPGALSTCDLGSGMASKSASSSHTAVKFIAVAAQTGADVALPGRHLSGMKAFTSATVSEPSCPVHAKTHALCSMLLLVYATANGVLDVDGSMRTRQGLQRSIRQPLFPEQQQVTTPKCASTNDHYVSTITLGLMLLTSSLTSTAVCKPVQNTCSAVQHGPVHLEACMNVLFGDGVSRCL